jgi:predicted NAD/FAD-dependent oxidoreductase
MAGLTAGAALQTRGWKVVLLDKGRRAGGRMATRRIGASHFDHGTQFFTVRDQRFRDAVERWEERGWATPWFVESGHVRYRAVRGMNEIAKKLAAFLDVRTETIVQTVEPIGLGWSVVTDGGEVQADSVILTCPAPQSFSLLAGCRDPSLFGIMSELEEVQYDPCFSLLAVLDGSSRVPPPGYIRLDEGPIEWIADNTQKGVSTGVAALTIHARAAFSSRYLECPAEEVAAMLQEAAAGWLGGPVAEWQLHRWRYSRPVSADRPVCLFTQQPSCLAVAGDAFGGSRLEGAFMSGSAAAERLDASCR